MDCNEGTTQILHVLSFSHPPPQDKVPGQAVNPTLEAEL
jgi:hypothetical protein